ncbi:MAG: hypothetical protein HFJ09_10930, partial [Lachnospiraceae bacterium]|nr:hypothetical protein [Lachnospiraceae bacterium]
MMNKKWKKKTLTAMVAMALIMQQMGANSVAYAKENGEYIEQEENTESFDDCDTEDGWEDADDIE